MTVRAILDTKGHHILSVEPDAKLSAAVKILGERKIGAVLVMSQGRLEGILSERDIVRVASAVAQFFRGGVTLPGVARAHQIGDVLFAELTSGLKSNAFVGAGD